MEISDSTSVQELSNCVEKLTHSGQKILDPTLVKKVKSICRLSDEYVEHAYHFISHQLDKDHAEIRYSAFQICDELFRRSHCFRELVISDMRNIMDLTAETSPDRKLPPPRSVALDLKRLALRTMQEWNKDYGGGYKKLQIGFNFLKHCKKIDFNALHNESVAEQDRMRERERRQTAVNQKRLEKINVEIADMEPEINDTIIAMQNCIALLLPTPEDFFITDADDEINDSVHQVEDLNAPSTSRTNTITGSSTPICEDESETQSINFREHGMLNGRHSIQIKLDMDVKSVKKTEANSAIIENAHDLFALLSNRYLPSIKKWIQIISKASGADSQLKKVMDLKQLLENATQKYNQLKLPSRSTTLDSTSESSDSDFEEVEEKEGYEETVKEDLMTTLIGESAVSNETNGTKEAKTAWSICSKENDEKDPTTPQSTITSMGSFIVPTKRPTTSSKVKQTGPSKKVKTAVRSPDDEMPSTSKQDIFEDRKTKLLAVAPKRPFDIDLYHWEDEHVSTPTMLAVFAEGSQFWSARPAEGMEEIPVPDGSASLRTRVIEYSGEFKPVKWACRAPIANGKLCPRKDRYKCPFHGRVVPRDKEGNCTNREDAERLQQVAEGEQAKNPDWQDPQLLAEIQAATGVDCTMPVKGKRGKKKSKEYPGLTDIKAKQNTSHSRLSKKVFKKSAMKRISKALDTMDHKRYRDKYGDQFHYMYNTA